MRVIPCLCVLLGGCFLNHSLDSDPGAVDGGIDAGFPDTALVIDAGFPDTALDGGGVDSADASPSSCRSVGAAELCHSPSFAETPTFAVTTTDCHCGGSLACHVDVVVPASSTVRGVLSVEIELCDEESCAACTGPNTVECSAPDAPDGDYHVHVSSGEFILTGLGGTPPTDPVFSECQSVGPAGGLCEAIGEPYEPAEVCLTPGRPIVVHGGSSCAYDPGPCSVDYITDFIGRSLAITPRQRSCDESHPVWDCETWQCPDAPEDGSSVAVFVGGAEVGRFDPEGGEQCFETLGSSDG